MKNFLSLLIAFLVGAFPLLAQTTTGRSITLDTPMGKLAGTLTLPTAAKPPVVLIIAGSGPTDRNGNNPMMTNNSLKMLAEELAKQGIASLRYDKRGIAESQPAGLKEEDMRFDTFINDAVGWINLLKADNQFSKVVVLGHSEGSLIGMIAANQAKADGFISVAGAGLPADKLIREQMKTQPPQVADMVNPALDSLAQGRLVKNVNPMLGALIRPSVQPYLISWFRYDPQAEIKKLTMPVLIIQGTSDIQVSEEQARLLANARPGAQLLIIDRMNHVLKESEKEMQANIATYSNATLPVVPRLVTATVDFVNRIK
ncbi:alpha/beta hydrolase [Nibrella saemangeumensis]|uniref:Alpha/beta hydrolase n=1 Tax=Nibrella saemangeumensis TaxID=1084526 RepID=A0ABP8NFW3_9BACT